MNRFFYLLCALPFFYHCAVKSMENVCDISGSLFYKTLFLNAVVSGNANVCGAQIGLPQPKILNLSSKALLNTGFLVGEMDASMSGVQVSLDGGPFLDAQISGTQWKFQLPAAGVPSTIPSTGVWKDWSLHTISARSVLGSNTSLPVSISVQKGNNKDIDGDGYPDALIGSQAANRVRAYLSLGKSRGLSSAVTTINGASGLGYSVALGDFDGDGYADAAAAGAGSNFALYLSKGASAPGLSTTTTSPTTVGNGILNLTVGDINGDGFSDLVVGSPYNAGNIGNVYTFLSNGIIGQGVSFQQQLNNPAVAGSTQFYGYAVALGDVDGDGRSDAMIAAVGSSQLGASFVYLSQGNNYTTYSQTFPGTTSNQWYANSIFATDINRDGLSDMIVGAYQEPSFAGSPGRIYVYSSTAGILSNVVNSPVVGVAASATGTSVGTGDINGDGFLDLFGGGYTYTGAFPNQGVVLTFLSMSSGGISSTSLNLLTNPVNMGEMGMSIGSADIDGDGFSDALLGAPSSVGGTNIGNVYLYFSEGATGYTSVPQTMTDPDGTGTFGSSVDL
ncbi:hypothetical protein DLM76_05740 [Leptospira yasudae]|uniref:FG-GAP and VCBS repeat-containing protein n=1 Tax=Leptospira yasudae TaxID=2202201 RepID=UPI000E59CA47|nr:FG-GAP-like repeat-containing protein [Leptospira yasudae]RHX94843.1 hypothetical protein DLM76_05740 [Leptospira yasudae]